MTIIKFRRGEKIDLPASAPSGMPLWCEDTKELYIGTNDSVTPVIANNSNEVTAGYVPYSVNSGNTDASGYADLIEKVSDTEVSFKIGGAYPNIGVTFPNGKFYEISSIANITNLSADSVYIFVLMEDNLTDLGDGTYSATVNAVSVGYVSQDNLVPIMASNSQNGFTVNVFDPYNDSEKANAYLLFDRNNSTGISFYWGGGHGLYATLNYITPIKMTKCQFYAPTSSGSLSGIVKIKAYGSNDGVNWTEVLDTGDMRSTGNIKNSPTFDCHSPDYYTNYKFQVTGVNLVGGYSSTTSNLRTINPYYDQEFLGGNITENLVLPASPEDGDFALLINQKPLKPYLRQSSNWIEKQFVKLGEVQKLSGLLGTPVSYAFNGYYDSRYNYVAKGKIIYIYTHNLGIDNYFVSNTVHQNPDGSGWVYDGMVDTTGSSGVACGVPSIEKSKKYYKTRSEGTAVAPRTYWSKPAIGYQRIVAKRSF
nr:hypothetical protein 4 [bacterium]